MTNGLCLFTVQGGEDFTGTAMITVLAQVNALPGAQCQSARRYRQTDLTAQHAGLEVRREVVQAFVVMLIAVCSLWDQTIEKSFILVRASTTTTEEEEKTHVRVYSYVRLFLLLRCCC